MLFASPRWQIALIEVEALLGTWLLAGLALVLATTRTHYRAALAEEAVLTPSGGEVAAAP